MACGRRLRPCVYIDNVSWANTVLAVLYCAVEEGPFRAQCTRAEQARIFFLKYYAIKKTHHRNRKRAWLECYFVVHFFFRCSLVWKRSSTRWVSITRCTVCGLQRPEVHHGEYGARNEPPCGHCEGEASCAFKGCWGLPGATMRRTDVIMAMPDVEGSKAVTPLGAT